jgi:hypothetical protein
LDLKMLKLKLAIVVFVARVLLFSSHHETFIH